MLLQKDVINCRVSINEIKLINEIPCKYEKQCKIEFVRFLFVLYSWHLFRHSQYYFKYNETKIEKKFNKIVSNSRENHVSFTLYNKRNCLYHTVGQWWLAG